MILWFTVVSSVLLHTGNTVQFQHATTVQQCEVIVPSVIPSLSTMMQVLRIVAICLHLNEESECPFLKEYDCPK